MALDTDAIIAQLKDATILELNDLVKAIEDEFGVWCFSCCSSCCCR